MQWQPFNGYVTAQKEDWEPKIEIWCGQINLDATVALLTEGKGPIIYVGKDLPQTVGGPRNI